MSLHDAIARAITQATGDVFQISARQPVSGGSINTTEVLEGSGKKFFVKLNAAARLDMFEAETEGLAEIADSKSVRVPQPVCSGTHGGQAFLVLEYLDLGQHSKNSDQLLGRQLAAMHHTTRARFGWRRANTIGSTPQINTPTSDWIEFWREHRLGYQLRLAVQNGCHILNQGERLMAELGEFFHSYRPVPSLLHGDLWGGNVGAAGPQPVIFDPAVYYGDREADLAMTELFGGFSARFYQAYQDTWPLDAGYPVRKTLYNLYHVLNHFNLFGGGYGAQAGRMIDRLLSDLRG